MFISLPERFPEQIKADAAKFDHVHVPTGGEGADAMLDDDEWLVKPPEVLLELTRAMHKRTKEQVVQEA